MHLRLKPNRNDRYYWKILDPGNEKIMTLFQNSPNQIPLSGLPKSVHEELQQHVGISFTAVPNDGPVSKEPFSEHMVAEVSRSFPQI